MVTKYKIKLLFLNYSKLLFLFVDRRTLFSLGIKNKKHLIPSLSHNHYTNVEQNDRNAANFTPQRNVKNRINKVLFERHQC